MPIGFLIGAAIGLFFAGVLTVLTNANPHTDVYVAVARGQARILGYILSFMSLGALIGTAFELLI